MKLAFSVPGLPVAQPRQRTRVVAAGGRTFAQNYTPARDPVNAFKASIRLALASTYQGAPLQGPVALVVKLIFPRPQAMVWKSRPMPRALKTTKPDWDNCGKAISDALNGLAWVDDAQVAMSFVQKWIAAGDEQAHAEIEVETL